MPVLGDLAFIYIGLMLQNFRMANYFSVAFSNVKNIALIKNFIEVCPAPAGTIYRIA
jgi:hypothetical protein